MHRYWHFSLHLIYDRFKFKTFSNCFSLGFFSAGGEYVGFEENSVTSCELPA